MNKSAVDGIIFIFLLIMFFFGLKIIIMAFFYTIILLIPVFILIICIICFKVIYKKEKMTYAIKICKKIMLYAILITGLIGILIGIHKEIVYDKQEHERVKAALIEEENIKNKAKNQTLLEISSWGKKLYINLDQFIYYKNNTASTNCSIVELSYSRLQQ